jgi:predicted lipoprotein with Yx(FWY)xxD motif
MVNLLTHQLKRIMGSSRTFQEIDNMKKNLAKILFLLIIGVFASATLLSGEVTASGVDKVGIKVMQKERLGKFLAAGNGLTLYSFTRDEKNVSHCIEGCAVNWPPFYVDPSAVVEGCESTDFATITRSDGKKQTTYKNMPLYHFIRDKYPGDTLGQGVGKVWFIITP